MSSAPNFEAAVTHEVVSRAHVAVDSLMQSKIAVNGLALAIAGFLGVFGALTLQLQKAIISVYVLVFGGLLIAFGIGAQSEVLLKYFGFMYTPNGHLVCLLLFGNLAWSIGLAGIAAAVFANLTAVASYLAVHPEAPGAAYLPEWLKQLVGARTSSTGPFAAMSATGMSDVQRDELL